MTGEEREPRFICDRMAGSLCRYLRFMGYDTLDANDLPAGNRKEDTCLLVRAAEEDRIILTRDAELARRDQARVVSLSEAALPDQIRQLVVTGLIRPELRLCRCSLCNTPLIPVQEEEYAEIIRNSQNFSRRRAEVLWCPFCRKGYWEGTHTSRMRARIRTITRGREGDNSFSSGR